MDQHYEFTEEMFRQLYRRMGYQVYRLCCHAEDDPQKAMDLTFRVFSDAYRKLHASAHPLTEEFQDATLLECARGILMKDAPAAPEPQPGFMSGETPDAPLPAGPFGEEPVPPSAESVLSAAGLTPVAPIEETREELAVPAPEPDFDVPAFVRENFGKTPAWQDVPRSSGSSLGWFLLIVVLVFFIFVLLWAIWGIAQTILPLPTLDLGYEWFNANIYPLF